MQNVQQKFVRALANLVDMLQYRGIDVSELQQLKNTTVSDLAEDVVNPGFLQSLTITLNSAVVYFQVDLKVTPEFEIKRHTIFVSLNPPKPAALKSLPANAIAFHIDELLVNPTQNELVPRHELVEDKEEIKQILAGLRAQFTQLPKIFVTDPMARYIGARTGDLVRITRVGKQAGEYVVYRAVI